MFRDNPLRQLDIVPFVLGMLGAVWFNDLRWVLTGIAGVMILEAVGSFLVARDERTKENQPPSFGFSSAKT